MSDFGASFKKARQSKGISLDQIALETRISTRFLQAIENEHFHLLPGGIFNRGFVRAYAERVGLDPEQAVVDYERLAQAQVPDDPMRPPSPSPDKVDWNLYPIAIGALALLIIIFYIVTRDSGTTAESANEVSAVSQPASPTPPVATPPPPPPDAAPAIPAPAEPLVLDIEAREITWVRVTADGNPVLSGENLEPGATRRFAAQKSLDVAIGNAGGITLKINGELVQRLGRSGQVREFTVTPKNAKEFISGNIR